MSYLARIAPQADEPVAYVPTLVPRQSAEPRFSPLEWSVVRLAGVDGLSTLRPPGGLRRFIGWLTGTAASSDLANPRLEALRRMAVLSRHHGFSVSGEDVAEFLTAGFSPDQYELLVHSVRAAAAAPSRNFA